MGLVGVLAATLRAVAAAAAWLCGLCFACFLYYAGSTQFEALEGALPALDFPPLDGSAVLAILCLWGGVLAALLITLAARRLLPARPPVEPAHGGLAQWVRRMLSTQLPPSTLWAGWCGGLSVAEAGGIAGWVGMNLYWLASGLRLIFSSEFPLLKDEQLNGVAKLFGRMVLPNLALLFMPIPHTNAITWLTGVGRNRLIRYHRWVGHGTMWILTVHAILYYAYWGTTGSFRRSFTAWGGSGEVSNLAGSCAYFAGLVLWGSSLTWVRRHFYELFFRLHIACFVAFFLLSCAHYPGCWLWFTPGLILYAADLALRAGQMTNLTTVAAATVDDSSGIATVVATADQAVRHRPLSEVWLSVPSLSRWQWHPFSVASGGGSSLKLHVKAYGRYTQRLLDALRRQQPLAVRLSGPMGNEMSGSCLLAPPPAWQRYETCIMFGGGVGVTALLSMLRCIAAERSAGQQAAAPLPRRVLCVWTARRVAEFSVLDAPLLRAAGAEDGWLTLQLHTTGGEEIVSDSKSSTVPSGAINLQADASRQGRLRQQLPAAPSSPGAAPPAKRMPGSSPFTWSMLRLAQPLSFGALHLAAVYFLAYFGALCGALLGVSYLQEPGTEQWRGGLVICTLISALALGLPYALAIFPLHAMRAAGRGATDAAEPYGEQAALLAQGCTLVNNAVSLPGEDISIQVQHGRPDIQACLRAAAAAAAEAGGKPVGVFAGGPRPMMRAVHLAVAELNGKGHHFELHNEAVEL